MGRADRRIGLAAEPGGRGHRARRAAAGRRRHVAARGHRSAGGDARVRRPPSAHPPQPASRRRVPGRHQRVHRARTAQLRAPAHRDGRQPLRGLRRRGRHRAVSPRARRHEGLLPPHRGRSGGLLPRGCARPSGLRRIGQAHRGPLQRGLVCPGGRRGAGCARGGARPPGRQQHGRQGRHRGGTDPRRPRGRAGAAEPGSGVAARPPLAAAGDGSSAPSWGFSRSRPGRSSRRWSAACSPAPWTTGRRSGWTSSCART